MHKNKDGVFATTPDSLRHRFKTLKGRTEYEAGGILPDTIVGQPEQSSLQKELLRKSMYFKFATRYYTAHKDTPSALNENEILKEFQKFLDEEKFSYEDEAESKLKEFEDAAGKSRYSPAIADAVDRLKTLVSNEKTNSVERNKDEVLRGLRMEIMSRYKGEPGRIEASLLADPQLIAAKGILVNQKKYEQLLKRK